MKRQAMTQEAGRMEGVFFAMFELRLAPGYLTTATNLTPHRLGFNAGWREQKERERLRQPVLICSWCGGSFRSAIPMGLCERCEARMKAEHDGPREAIQGEES